MERATRKPGKCDSCGAPLRAYAAITGSKGEIIATEDAALCCKCKTVFKRPVCFDKCTLELNTDSAMVTTILKKITVKVAEAPVAELLPDAAEDIEK